MIVQSTELKIGEWLIPEFELKPGELIGICLYSGAHVWEVYPELIDLLTGRKMHLGVRLTAPLKWIKRFKENRFKRVFFPTTVKDYLAKNGKPDPKLLRRILEKEKISNTTHMKALNFNSQKWLTFISMFSQSNQIVFDMMGQDPIGRVYTLDLVKEFVSQGGAAIWIDWIEMSGLECTRVYPIERLD
ncbi:MAG: hypothetical protein AAFW00_18605 [Bacteroidota bacterium]